MYFNISDHIHYTISRYRSRICQMYDIVADIYRTISCTNARLARALLTYRSAESASDWCRSPYTPSVALSCLTFPGVDLSCSVLGAWGGGRQLHQWWA